MNQERERDLTFLNAGKFCPKDKFDIFDELHKGLKFSGSRLLPLSLRKSKLTEAKYEAKNFYREEK